MVLVDTPVDRALLAVDLPALTRAADDLATTPTRRVRAEPPDLADLADPDAEGGLRFWSRLRRTVHEEMA